MADTTQKPQRTSIFSSPGEVAEFKPKEKPPQRPTPAEIDQVSAPSKFSRREAPDQPPTTLPSPSTDSLPSTKRKPMVYRTGRNVTISVKTTAETVDRFYRLAEKLGWKAGETFENAVEGLVKIHGLD